MKNSIEKQITIDPKVCHGKPIVKGTRIPVTTVLELMEDGMSQKEILRGFPSLTPKSIKAAIHFAISRINHEEFIPVA